MLSVRNELRTELNAPDRRTRLAASVRAGGLIRSGELSRSESGEVNNHVHTFYSFSPYSPSLAAFRAWEAGLRAVGVMDHDSVAGADEMREAGKALGIATTAGCEIRVNMSGTLAEGRRINNPDSVNIAYIALHGIPASRLGEAGRFLAPIQARRHARNREQTEALNRLTGPRGIAPLDYERDVLTLSRADEGGSVTERHILYALSEKLVSLFGRGEGTLKFLRGSLGLDLPRPAARFLADAANPHYLYDLLGVLKSAFLHRFFIQPDDQECVAAAAAVSAASSLGAIPAYAYLGDVTDSPTGDKKAESFEDSYLDELVPELKRLGFRALTYMPPRNTKAQLARVSALCRREGLMEISGVDINSSRQSFSCPEVMDPAFSHLLDATWALIAHEHLAGYDPRYALFADENPWAGESTARRISRYADAGRRMDPRHPERIIDLVRK
jgi:PHP domain